MSECRLVNQPRGTQRYQLTQREDEDALTRAIVELASRANVRPFAAPNNLGGILPVDSYSLFLAADYTSKRP